MQEVFMYGSQNHGSFVAKYISDNKDEVIYQATKRPIFGYLIIGAILVGIGIYTGDEDYYEWELKIRTWTKTL